ncbi:hypothetical protein [Flavobacterium sp.]|jgi:hypothetical protein|uniref:hypothetical protein n=1 Tax=Flavobacterium sp. TaxID=239 RepID=UPI0037C11763
MKKILFTLILLITTVSLAQKAKTPVAATSNTLATFENLKAEIVTDGGKQKLAIVLENNGKKETIILKEITTKDKAQQPTNFKIKVFTIADIKLYHFSYTENIITETKLKKENAVITSNEIWELSTTKLKILGNIQTISQINEIRFLDKNKTASQTVDKTRKEGFEFTLTKDFEVHLSTKTQTNKYKFNTTTRRYDPKK